MREVLLAHFARYPAMTAQDAVKLLYQATFGPGHLIADPAMAAKRLTEERAECSKTDAPAFELGAAWQDDVVTAFGRIGGETVGFVGAKGKLAPAACRKIAGFVRLLDSYSLPVVTFVDTQGAEIADCEACAMKSAAALAASYMTATVARVCVITGSAVSAASAALASRAAADCAAAWPNAVISALPTPAATQLAFEKELHDAADPISERANLEKRYEAEIANPVAAALKGDIDDVIDPENTRAYVVGALTMLSGKRASLPAKKHGCLPM